MARITDEAKVTYASGPSSNPTEPNKADIIRLFTLIDTSMSSLIDGLVIGGAIVYSTRAALYADVARPAGTLAVVYNDSTAAYNGVYVKSGVSGSGSWAITSLALPSTFAADLAAVIASNAGKLDNTITALTTLTGTAETKETPIGSDGMLIRDSEDGLTIKRISLAILKTLYLDRFYASVAAAVKAAPVTGDAFGIFDSEESNAPKRLSLGVLRSFLKTYFDGLYPSKTLATDRLLGRDTAGTGDVEAIALTGGLAFTGSSQIGLDDMPQATFKGRAAGAGTGTPTDLSVAQAKAAQDITGVTTAVVEGKLDSTIAALSDLTDTADIKEDLVGADGFLIRDSADGLTIKRSSVAILRAFLKTYFDGFYPFAAASAKVTPIDADIVGYFDSEASSAPKRMTWANVKATLKIYFDGLYPSKEDIDTLIPPVADVSPGLIPLHIAAASNQAAVWLENGMLSAKGMAPGLRRDAISDVISSFSTGGYSTIPVGGMLPLVTAGSSAVVWLNDGDLDARGMAPPLRAKAVSDIVNSFSMTGGMTPVLTAGASVIAWVDDTGLEFAKLSTGQVGKLKTALSPSFASRVSPLIDGNVPVSTDGRTLSRWRAKLAALDRSVAGTRVSMGLAGDSWADLNTIPLSFAGMLGGAFGPAGDGFRSVAPDGSAYTMDPVVLITKSGGWTLVDGSATTSHPYGAGPDGNSIYTTGATETYQIAGLIATDIKIFYHKYGGTFRWQVDGGSWATVTSDSSGNFGVVTITGLADAAHTLSIDTTGNASTVSLAGTYSRRSVSGAIILKIGNAGLRGDYLQEFVEYIAAPVAEMDIDAIAVFLGTNDYRAPNATPAKYATALRDLIAEYRTAQPDIGIILVAPSRSNGVTANPLYLYRNAAYQVAIEEGVEFLNLYDQWGTNAQSVSLGLWESGLHVNATGATDIMNLFNETFLKVRA